MSEMGELGRRADAQAGAVGRGHRKNCKEENRGGGAACAWNVLAGECRVGWMRAERIGLSVSRVWRPTGRER